MLHARQVRGEGGGGRQMRFAFERTISNSPEDLLNCQYIPGYLIPSDLQKISKHLGYDNAILWGLDNLLASPGAVVLYQGKRLSIRTLVPQRQENTHCKFLKNNLCTIHSISPFGCAYFDSDMTRDEADRRSTAGLIEVMKEWTYSFSDYTGLWTILFLQGKVSPSPNKLREKLQEALDRYCV